VQYTKTSNTQIFAYFQAESTNMPLKIDYADAAVQKVMAAMDANPRLKGTTAAQQFGAPYNQLMACWRGRPVSNTRGGYNKKLDVP